METLQSLFFLTLAISSDRESGAFIGLRTSRGRKSGHVSCFENRLGMQSFGIDLFLRGRQESVSNAQYEAKSCGSAS
jgi:hypothetical protein